MKQSVVISIPYFPDFVSLNIELKDILHPRLSLTIDGVSEFTFSGLYLFRNRYNYRISRNSSDNGFIISGELYGKKFFMTPCSAPDPETLNSLFASHDYWKNISETVLSPVREQLEERGIAFAEDRDNFDYLYYRSELADLSGKKYHKKKNHVNHFLQTYPAYEQKPMSRDLIPAAAEVLEIWRQDKGEDGDYKAAKEALSLFDSLTLRGSVFFVDGKPAAWCLGESLAKGKMFAIHFEKAVEEYKGIYQFVNQSFAASLPRFFTFINREQDLGNEGMRQAKMTYRPCGFVKKYRGQMGCVS
ncbi:MAG: phosphatidylglycerol lysyltransferase domain-containing protein [Treponema sp.]|jgi:hypothetical protein|nr:phosphatidylglycerol lysyltransferase domain-containing protein [Treponema sp.]